MNPTNCVHCGKETGAGELYCADCRAISATPRRKSLWGFSIAFSVLILLLAGLVLWHGGFSLSNLSLDFIWAKPAAVINGESISRAELKGRIKTIQAIVERQHGKEIFAGERGRALWANLQNAVLNELLEKKLVNQEGRKLGIQISDEQVKQKVEIITKEVFGTWEKFQARLQEEGMSEADLQENIRNLLLLEAIKTVKAQEGANPDASFNAWLTQARQEAKVTVYNSGKSIRVASALAGGCCSIGGSSGGCSGRGGSSAGCSGGGGTARQADPRIEREAQTAALQTFQKSNPEEKGVTAKVTDYGCHIQVDIEKNGKIVKSYVYQGGKVFENS